MKDDILIETTNLSSALINKRKLKDFVQFITTVYTKSLFTVVNEKGFILK